MAPFDPPLDAREVAVAFPGRYVELELLKAGGQGAVFRAHRVLQNGAARVVALKLYASSQLEERTEREIESLRQIDAPQIVRLVDTGRVRIRGAECVWLETEFIDGSSLADRIAREPLSEAECIAIVRDIAKAVVTLWDRRIVHRDIKPENVMIRPNGGAVLIDLGVARHLTMEALTTYGMTWGTQGYLSPEQFRAVRALTSKSDIFALGVVAQEALLGRHPTVGNQRLLMTSRVAIELRCPEISVAAAALLNAMTASDPIRRPRPEQVVTRCEEILRSLGPQA